MVNYSTPDRSLLMPYPRVKSAAAVLWAGLADGVRYTVFALCFVLYFRKVICSNRLLQVYQDLTYFFSCFRNVTLFISLNCCSSKKSGNQGE